MALHGPHLGEEIDEHGLGRLEHVLLEAGVRDETVAAPRIGSVSLGLPREGAVLGANGRRGFVSGT